MVYFYRLYVTGTTKISYFKTTLFPSPLKYNYFKIQWTLSISNTLYLKLLSITNNFLGPFPLIPAYVIFSLYSNKFLDPLRVRDRASPLYIKNQNSIFLFPIILIGEFCNPGRLGTL